jgi:hypothetical protein
MFQWENVQNETHETFLVICISGFEFVSDFVLRISYFSLVFDAPERLSD